MAIRPWFPTFIYDAPLVSKGGARLSRELLGDCYRIRQHDLEGRQWCRKNYPGGFTSYATMNRLHQSFSTFMELERRLAPHVRALARHLQMELGRGELGMTDCWVNIMPRHAVHSLHLHPLSVLSGSYYVKTPRGCSRIRFEDPRLDRFMAAPPRTKSCRPENRRHVTYAAEAGRILLFESWLRHEVATNTVSAERISISFNFAWR